MTELDAVEVARRLGLAPPFDRWLTDLEAVGAPVDGLAAPGAGALRALLQRLAVEPVDVEAVVDTTPTPGRDPAWWWILERCHRRLAEALGDLDAPRGWWPQLPLELGPRARCLWAHVYCSVVPLTRAWHEAHGVPDPVSWATLGDLGRHMALHRRMFDVAGIDEPWWLTLHLRGELFECGRLQFDRHRLGPYAEAVWYPETEASVLGVGFREGDPTVGIHIPEAGPLTPVACDASFDEARSLFARCFPESDRRIAVCTSWLLDAQLAAYLPVDSNILRFQRRFELVPGGVDGDQDVLGFVFRAPQARLDDLPQTTTLERAAVEHLRSGGHWRACTGWLRL